MDKKVNGRVAWRNAMRLAQKINTTDNGRTNELYARGKAVNEDAWIMCSLGSVKGYSTSSFVDDLLDVLQIDVIVNVYVEQKALRKLLKSKNKHEFIKFFRKYLDEVEWLAELDEEAERRLKEQKEIERKMYESNEEVV